jgi:hypothetical protein
MNKSDAALTGILSVVAVVVGLGLWLFTNKQPRIKHISVPVYSDIIRGQVIKNLAVDYYDYMDNGTLVYAAAYTDDNMDINVDGFSSLHEALNTIRKIVTGK